ncbi:MAG: hypothetical protein P1V97_12850 [Planctomycetota bacterium]|nr:hypothetical protein [Planctomycetota bacterium]
MTPQKSAALILAKMALADDILDPAELDFLEQLLAGHPELGTINELVEEARDRSLKDLAEGLEKYPDRFLVAFRVLLMASVDQHLDPREQALYQELITLLKITKSDSLLLEKTEASARAGQLQEPDPRINQMYEDSSFFEGQHE